MNLKNTHVPVMFWRSVGSSQNAFAVESFVDKVAHEARQDPLEYRRARLADRHIALELTDAARTHLVRSGYDPTYGARPLKRAIQKEIETPLARLVLAGKVKDGQTVDVDLDPKRGELRFTPRAAAAG